MEISMDNFSNDSSGGIADVISENTSQFATILLTVYVSIVVTVGATGNILTIYTMFSVKTLRTTANFLVASLAAADSGMAIISVPVIFSRFRFPEFHGGHPFFCRVSYFLMVFFAATSVNHLQVIAFNRYFIITRPRHTYRKFFGRVGIMVVMSGVWLYSLILVLLPFVGFGDIAFIPELGGCGIVETTRLSWWYKTCLLLVVVESCGIVTPFFFILTFKKIHAAKRRLESMQAATQTAIPGAHSKPRGFSRHEMAVTRMTVLVFLCFLVCWSPYLALHALTPSTQKPGVLATAFLVFAFSSSVFNPFIYAGMNKNFRRAFFLSKIVMSTPVTMTETVVTSVA